MSSGHIAGTQVRAGLGVSTVLPDLDFETYSEAGYLWDEPANKWRSLPNKPTGKKDGLFLVGSAVYAMHPSTEVLCMHYDLKDGQGIRRWRPGMPPPYDLIGWIRAGGLVEAHNSGFEWWIWNYVCTRKYGWPALPQAALRCSMSKARAFGMPGGLEMLGTVLQLPTQKDKDGKRLLDKFSTPRSPTKKDARRRITPADDPEDGARLYSYCDDDIRTESLASAQLPDLEGEELEYWHLDQRINQRGVHVDRAGMNDAIAIIQQAHAQYNIEITQITGGIEASKLQQLRDWLLDTCGVLMPSMDAEAIEEALKRTDLDPRARRVLEIREALGSASVKKVFIMSLQLTEHDRLHNLYNYHAARTGRPTGADAQPTNMPKAGPPLIRCQCGRHHALKWRACPWCGVPVPPGRKADEWGARAAEEVLGEMRHRDYRRLEHYYGSALFAVSGCLRGLYTAAPGHRLICSDFNAIEGVVTAQLAGEEWRLEVFRTHGKIYEMSASKITGVPFEEMMEFKKRTGGHHPMRNKIGKFAELALGFGGWVSAMTAFGAGEFLSETEMRDAIIAWRDASPMIVELWGGQYRGLPWQPNCRPERYGLEGAAITAVENPGTWQTYRLIAYIKWGDTLFCRLPSGRYIAYQRPRLSPGTLFNRGDFPTVNLSYSTWNTDRKKGMVGWVSMETYGGRLAENVVQATARDIQRYAGLALERAGYPIVLHVYDENVSEVPEGFGSLEEYERIMATMPPWAEGWPIRASGGWVGYRYNKG